VSTSEQQPQNFALSDNSLISVEPDRSSKKLSFNRCPPIPIF